VKKQDGFYGSYARFARRLLRGFSRKYRYEGELPAEPVVYVCRHLNMHGPYTTLKWLPGNVHPMILHVFFDRVSTVKHMTEYTFGARYGKKPRQFSLLAHISSWFLPPLMKSLQGIPTYRDGLKTVTTMKQGLNYLLRQENVIVFPDVDYASDSTHMTRIYDGFLYLGELYYKKTGRTLSFVPLRINDQSRTITAGEPVQVTDYRVQRYAASEKIRSAIGAAGDV
jgi:1-acyl-sn-glycerol-3-phosphate acyltransferase